MNTKKILPAFLLLLTILVGCTEKNAPGIKCEPEELTFSLLGGKNTINLIANDSWTVTTNKKWVTISPMSGQGDAFVEIVCQSGEQDEAQILFSTNKGSATLIVKRNDHEYVDLGLSVKWATMNVGANTPEEYGNYYAWGETSPKNEYTRETYKLSNFWENGLYCGWEYTRYTTDYAHLSLGDDAAYINWGGKWRIPTYEEWSELFNQCTFNPSTQNSIKGITVRGKNGNTIFLPIAGYYSYDGYHSDRGKYWSSNLAGGRAIRQAEYAFFIPDSKEKGIVFNIREDGFSIRAVHP